MRRKEKAASTISYLMRRGGFEGLGIGLLFEDERVLKAHGDQRLIELGRLETYPGMSRGCQQ